jgi:hypothetical protein
MSPLAMALAKMLGASLSKSGVRRQAFLSSGVEIFNGFWWWSNLAFFWGTRLVVAGCILWFTGFS